MNADRRWYQLSTEEVLEQLGTTSSGLTEDDAKSRLAKYGPNKLQKAKKTSRAVLFLQQFLSPLIYVLLVAVVISLVVEHYLDAAVIGGVLLLNAIIGYVQETRAEEAMEALIQMAAPKAKVRREGNAYMVPSTDIVPGDLVLLESGDMVPADARIIEASNLKVSESALTGESVAVDKGPQAIEGDVSLADRKDMAFMGTSVTRGRGVVAVVSTGMSTEMGKIATAIKEVEQEKTPLQKSISSLSKYLIVVFLVICTLLVTVGLLQGLEALEIFLVAVAAAVSAIPEGLPAVVTVILALGMRTMASRNAIIRKLVAVETLGAATVICTDKTGTLTLNEMTVRKIVVDGKDFDVSGEGYEPKGDFLQGDEAINSEAYESLMMLLRIGLLCNDSTLSSHEGQSSIVGDPTEGALVVVAGKAGLKKSLVGEQYKRLDEIPFESEKRYMATMHPQDGKQVAYVKGAPERLLSMSSQILHDGQPQELGDEDKERVQQTSQAMAEQAMRVMAFAYAELPDNTSKLEEGQIMGSLVFVGLVGMEDPPREEAIRAVSLCKQAGIRVVMITGDNRITAESVGRQLGLPHGRSVIGSELEHMSDEELLQEVDNISVYARVEPLHKLRIVNAFKARGQVVAMTGDGVNDAPALKAASIGIAMGIKGTDVSKEASDMVLADDNFASIVAAVDEGRAIFNKLRNVIFFLLSTNIGELVAFLISLIFVGQAPLLAVQIIWVNLVTDAAVGLPLGLEPKIGDELEQPPRHPSVGLLYPGLLLRVAFLATIMSVGVFAIFNWYEGRVSLEEARTMAFCTLVAFEWFRAFNARSDEHTVFSLGLFRNKYLLASIGLAASLQVMMIYAPFMQTAFSTVSLGAGQWGIAVGAGGALFTIEELRKVIAPKLFSRGKWNPA
jgi:Ca2+-transporting ATPase